MTNNACTHKYWVDTTKPSNICSEYRIEAGIFTSLTIKVFWIQVHIRFNSTFEKSALTKLRPKGHLFFQTGPKGHLFCQTGPKWHLFCQTGPKGHLFCQPNKSTLDAHRLILLYEAYIYMLNVVYIQYILKYILHCIYCTIEYRVRSIQYTVLGIRGYIT